MAPDWMRLWWRMLPAMAGMGLLCSCQDGAEQARDVVLEAGYKFTITDFLKAASEGRGAVVSQFLAAGMNVNAEDRSGGTALRLAAAGGHGHLTRQLLEAGAAVDQADSQGFTPLMAAAAAGDTVSVQALLEAGARPSGVNSQGHHALAVAAAAGHAGVVELLGPATGGSSGGVLLLACAGGHTGVIDALLKAELAGTRAPLDWQALLAAAAREGHLPAIRLLSSRMPDDPRSAGARTAAIQAATGAGHPDIANFLTDELGRQTAVAVPVVAVADPNLDSGTTSDATESDETASDIPAPPPDAPASVPVALRPSSPPARIAGARFTRIECENLAAVPERVRMLAWEPQAWPVVLQDVTTDHAVATVLLTEEPQRTVTLKVGDEIPGTGCVVEKLRRRRLYTDATETVLKNVSELHFRRDSTGEKFKALAGDPVLSNDSSAHLRIQGVERSQSAGPGDEFRLGSLLLRVSRIASGAITFENRLTRETVTVPLTAVP